MRSIDQGPKMMNQYLNQYKNNIMNQKLLTISDLFQRLNLDKYTQIFHEQEIDLDTFLTMTDQDLRELGVANFGPRRKMMMAISDLSQESPENRDNYLKNQYQVTQLTMNIGSEW